MSTLVNVTNIMIVLTPKISSLTHTKEYTIHLIRNEGSMMIEK